jgi:hypothetical protein
MQATEEHMAHTRKRKSNAEREARRGIIEGGKTYLVRRAGVRRRQRDDVMLARLSLSLSLSLVLWVLSRNVTVGSGAWTRAKQAGSPTVRRSDEHGGYRCGEEDTAE